MKLELTPEVKITLQKAFKLLKGASRRLFMASVVVQLEKGGQRLAEQELGWNRDLIRKGVRELKSGMTCASDHTISFKGVLQRRQAKQQNAPAL